MSGPFFIGLEARSRGGPASAWLCLLNYLLVCRSEIKCPELPAPRVSKGFEKFVEYSERGTAEQIASVFPDATDAVQ